MEQKVYEMYQKWVSEPSLDTLTRKQLADIENNEDIIFDSFYKELEFGTAGLRGIIGVGSNRMNVYTVRRATQGLANYLKKHYENSKVAIAYDSRNFSKVFAYEAANVLSSNNIEAYVFDSLQATPVLSYAVRYLSCQAGINITASHNPAEYNGYKVYGEDGCQINNDVADEITKEIENVDIFNGVSFTNKEHIHVIDQEVFDSYIASTLKQSIIKGPKHIKIIYTPLNGAGLKPVTTILREDGFSRVYTVKKQANPNGNFPTCPYPNPEMKEALQLGVQDLESCAGDILIATDPDSDRVGFVCKDYLGIHYFTGNEVGILLFDFILRHNKKIKDGIIVKTIVSTNLINIIAEAKKVEVREVLTGFKYIGGVIKELENNNEQKRFLLGFEESCGYLTNTDVRDKDAVNASMLIAELSEELYLNNSSPYLRLQEIYRKYGKYITKTLSYELKGSEGAKRINQLMEDFRNNKLPLPVLNPKISNDYLLSVSHTPTGDVEIKLPKSNVLKYIYDNGDTLTIRPSGTEPKIKIYVFSKEEQTVNQIEQYFNELIK